MELGFADLDRLPLNVANYLAAMSGKTIFLFATVPFQADDVQISRIHKSVAGALPHECDYRGMYISPAQPSQMLLEGFRHAAQVKPHSTRIRHWLRRCELAVERPNEKDFDDFICFAAHVLDLKI